MFNLVLTAILRANISNFVSGLKTAGSQLQGFQGLLQGLGAALNVGIFMQVLNAIVSMGRAVADMVGGLISANAEWQRMRISMATILSNSSILTDGTGKILEGQEKLNAAYAKSGSLIKQARLMAALNVGTTEELLEAWTSISTLVSGVSKKGEDSSQKSLQLANRIMTAAKVLGPGVLRGGLGQAVRESNELLSGRITILNKFATGIGLTKEEFKKLQKEGISTYDILMKKLEPFIYAQGLLAKSMAGVTDTLRDVGQYMAVEIGKFGFERLNQALNELVNNIIVKTNGIPTGFVKAFDEVANALAPIFDELIIPLINIAKEFLQIIVDQKDLIIDGLRLSVQVIALILDILTASLSVTRALFTLVGPGIRLVTNGLSLVLSLLRKVFEGFQYILNGFTQFIEPMITRWNELFTQYIRGPLQQILSAMGLSTDLAKEQAKADKESATAADTKASAIGGINSELEKNNKAVKDNTQHWKNWIATMRSAFSNRVPTLTKSFLTTFGNRAGLNPTSGGTGTVPVTFNFNTASGAMSVPGRMTPQDIATARGQSKSISAGITNATRRNSYAPVAPNVTY